LLSITKHHFSILLNGILLWIKRHHMLKIIARKIFRAFKCWYF